MMHAHFVSELNRSAVHMSVLTTGIFMCSYLGITAGELPARSPLVETVPLDSPLVETVPLDSPLVETVPLDSPLVETVPLDSLRAEMVPV
jgi:hypothetical protein